MAWLPQSEAQPFYTTELSADEHALTEILIVSSVVRASEQLPRPGLKRLSVEAIRQPDTTLRDQLPPHSISISEQ
jgi:hypothetical protein